jgi:hypothetical protein
MSLFAMLAGMEEHKRDYSTIDSEEKAKALHREGKLELLYLFPLEFGGKQIPQNTLYVPPGIAAIKQQIDGMIRDLVMAGEVAQYSAVPEYKGDSFIPSKIKISTSHPEKPGGVSPTINIW